MANVGSLFVLLGIKASNYQKGLAKAEKDARKSMKAIEKEFKSLDLKHAEVKIAAFAGTFAFLERHVLNVAGKFQQLKISLDTVTKGQGAKWFQQLNQFALDLPVSVDDVVDSFRKMTAMNLNPNIEQMQILVDTTSALGGNKDVLDGITLALGQIATKNKLMSQEVRQLAERGIPAYKILQDEIGVTAEELERVGHASIDGEKALGALFRGMQKAFGGQTRKMIET
ncbi:MAG: tape measure protein, partial [Syntrophales bacterium]|nr:tape measure protein [Syntrophales bacterium]